MGDPPDSPTLLIQQVQQEPTEGNEAVCLRPRHPIRRYLQRT